ncbi:hypothetical protein SCYAM73S_03148 [Streptomyces cyaneofuscatus]
MLTDRLIGVLGEPANELLEYRAHSVVGNNIRAQIEIGKFTDHMLEQPSAVQPSGLPVEIKAIQNLASFVRERPYVDLEIFRRVRRI